MRLTNMMMSLGLLLLSGHAAAQTTVTVSEAGGLQEAVEQLAGTRPEALTVKGPLNGTDIKYLRTLMEEDGSLTTLDLSEVSIVAGGDAYATGMTPDSSLPDATAFYTADDVLGDYMFADCPLLSSLVLPSSVRYIGVRCFAADIHLTELVVPEGVERIGTMAFTGCYQLVQVDLPSTLLSIDAFCFRDCPQLSKLLCRAAIPPAYGYRCLADLECELVFPNECSDDVMAIYGEADGWGRLSQRKEDVPTGVEGFAAQARHRDAAHYGVDGVPATQSAHGVVIQDGRKRVVR